jgi:hypothetical protein
MCYHFWFLLYSRKCENFKILPIKLLYDGKKCKISCSLIRKINYTARKIVKIYIEDNATSANFQADFELKMVKVGKKGTYSKWVSLISINLVISAFLALKTPNRIRKTRNRLIVFYIVFCALSSGIVYFSYKRTWDFTFFAIIVI